MPIEGMHAIEGNNAHGNEANIEKKLPEKLCRKRNS